MNSFSLDLEKYKKYSGGKSTIILFITTQGLWALLIYRISNKIYRSKLPKYLKKILLLFAVLNQKLIEILTGISLPYTAKIGKRFYIGHPGQIILNGNTTIGVNCNISQGVTIGVSGRGDKRGVPVIGNNVYMGANAVIAGKIKVGDGVVIGANTLVINDISDNVTVLGVPAKKISNNNSDEYI